MYLKIVIPNRSIYRPYRQQKKMPKQLKLWAVTDCNIDKPSYIKTVQTAHRAVLSKPIIGLQPAIQPFLSASKHKNILPNTLLPFFTLFPKFYLSLTTRVASFQSRSICIKVSKLCLIASIKFLYHNLLSLFAN